MNIDEFTERSVRYCVEQDTVEGLAEAIAICISNIRDEQGKHLRVYLSEDYNEHLQFCVQIAKQLKKASEK